MFSVIIPGEKKLRPICKALGLVQKGNKAELLQRLTKNGLTLEEILLRANNIAPPVKCLDLAEEFRNLRHESEFYATQLPTFVHDVPGEKYLRNICKQLTLTQSGNKVDLLKRLLDHPLSFDDIVNFTSANDFSDNLPSLNTEQVISSFTGESLHSSHENDDDDVMDTLPPSLSEPVIKNHLFTFPFGDKVEEEHFIREMERLDAIELSQGRDLNSKSRLHHFEMIAPPNLTTNIADTLALCPEPMASPLPSESFPLISDLSNDDMDMDTMSTATFVCNVCGKNFAQKRYLHDHMKIHRPQPVQCNVCGKNFAQKRYLHDHMKIHGPQPVQCNVCGKNFAQKPNFLEHMKIHGPQPVQCNVCGKNFAQKRYLHEHMKIHNVINPKDFGGKIITFNEARDGFQYINFSDRIQGEILHIVCIPWFDHDGNYVNVSVGFTKNANVPSYASHIWRAIKNGIDDGDLYLSGCGSGRLAASKLDWVMNRKKSFSLQICVASRVIANRVKGYVLDSVYILSANDNNNFLCPCIGAINEKVRNAMPNLSVYNINAFHENLRGVGQQASFRLNVTATRQFSFEGLDVEL